MDGILQLDGDLLIRIQQALSADWLTHIMKFITMLGEYGALPIALCLILLAFQRTRRLGIICSASLLLTFICCNIIIKPLVDRARPWEIIEEVIPMLPHPGDASFPSGHTANTFAPAWAAFLSTMPRRDASGVRSYDMVSPLGWRGIDAQPRMMHRLSIGLLCIAFVMGLSRLYLGMHYPSDVMAAIILAALCAAAVFTAIEKYENKKGIIGHQS